MRRNLFIALAAALALLAPVAGSAQDPAAVAAQPADVRPAPKSIDKKIERIRIEDAGTRIDELRYGGETKSITVQPKFDVPEYEVVPPDGAKHRPQIERDNAPGTGQRVWKVFGF